MYRKYGKRILDILAALCALLCLLPLMLLIALLIKVFDPGPVLFVQQRVGRNGATFRFYKFRSMPVNTGNVPSDQLGNVKLTWIGRFIRRSNVDELPQLLNIAKGDMSIVGPRPPIPSQTELVERRALNGALAARPGLTGLAQIKSFDGMTIAQKAEFDGIYVRDVSFIGDMTIIFGTFGYLLKPPPVY